MGKCLYLFLFPACCLRIDSAPVATRRVSPEQAPESGLEILLPAGIALVFACYPGPIGKPVADVEGQLAKSRFEVSCARQ